MKIGKVPPPWDVSLGGDGCPKFLCDCDGNGNFKIGLLFPQIAGKFIFKKLSHPAAQVEGLAKHLRCVGIDAAVPPLKKPQTRDLIEQASKEKRVLITRDAKLLRHGYLIENQVYRVKKSS
nr:exonuclease mut-7 homolog [Ipomoea batatas]